MAQTSSIQWKEMVPHCLMCGALIQRGEGVVKWREGLPFTFCTRECQSDYGFVNARGDGFGLRLHRDFEAGLYHSQRMAAEAVQ